MPFTDWPLEQLKKYKPKTNRAPDFDAFWKKTLLQSRQQPLNVTEEKIDYPINSIEVFKIKYDGFINGGIVGYYLRPKGLKNIPVVMVYHGYTGHKGYPIDHLAWLSLGCAVCTVDTRDQTGESYDGNSYGTGHQFGWMTKGIDNPDNYYYRYVYMDCVRAIDYVLTKPEIDKTRIAVTGGSQGGGISLATAALDSRVKLCMADIPFLCHFRRSLDVASGGPYLEILQYYKQFPDKEEKGLNTLSYIDNLNLAGKIKAKTLISVGLQDAVCPPSSIYGVFNQVKSPKEMKVYNYLGHEFLHYHANFKFQWLAKQWKFD